MADNIISVNSADTLSLFFKPGEDKRLFNTNSDSIFTFGDFKIYKDNNTDALTGTNLNLSFDSFSTLESLGVSKFASPQSYFVNHNELNFPKNDPKGYSYFGSFYTEIADSINNIIEGFPYALLAFDGNSGFTIYDYVQTYNNINGDKRASFKIPYSTIINQGNIIINSGSTASDAMSLINNMTGYSIQMSAQTSASTKVIDIISYNFSAGVGSYLEFTINDFLDYMSGPTSTYPIYIRPTKQRFAEYKMKISKLEQNLLFDGRLIVPNIETDTSEIEQKFIWPKTIDGFSPDTYGASLDTYQKNILKAAADIDDSKTNIMLKTMIPENFLDMDSSGEIYKKTVQAYAHEFDEIKNYIDGIAYAHSLQYNGEESLPQKFMYKFSNLLGWKLSDSFSEVDLFEYLAGDADGAGNSYSKFNIEIWKRILVNINWLYKKKGTRDALQFLFKLLGAPDCLVEFDEFVYKIKNVGGNISSTAITNSKKINEHGFIQYSQSDYVFQEGGKESGDGHKYIFQWTPEFAPEKQIDDIKIVTGDTSVFGSEDTINTKEINLNLSPAAAIECDVFNFYKQTGTTWGWGSGYLPFSSMTVPYEFSVGGTNVRPANISSMTLFQWMNYVYSNSIDPRNRKVLGSPPAYHYPMLKNAYLNYFYWTTPKSHALTFQKLQGFLNLIENNFTDYTKQLLPATTIIGKHGTIIRNTMFHRQKFIYKPGLNDGSEFRSKLPPYFVSSLKPVSVVSKLNDYLNDSLTPAIVIGKINSILELNVPSYQIVSTLNSGIKSSVVLNNVSFNMNPPFTKTVTVGPALSVPSDLNL